MIKDCPKCGGTHYGSIVCPFTDEEIAKMETGTTANGTNDDVMRMKYRPMTADEQAQMTAVKGNAASLYGFLGTLGNSRELSLAKTKLEEAVMWATKHITG